MAEDRSETPTREKSDSAGANTDNTVAPAAGVSDGPVSRAAETPASPVAKPGAPKTPAEASAKSPSAVKETKAAPPPPPFKAAPSQPYSMATVRPEAVAKTAQPQFEGELEEEFGEVLNRVKFAPRGRLHRWPLLRLFVNGSRAMRLSRSERHVAFDGFHTNLHDEKIERDRRYGTVYTVCEELNAYLVRLEFPRIVPESSLKHVWQLPDEMPDYQYSITLADGVLSIRAGVPGEAFRRLSYISASFPSDFLTRIQFEQPVAGFKHRLRDKVLEVIVLKTEDRKRGVAAFSGQPAS
jgi:hypothetical protein